MRKLIDLPLRLLRRKAARSGAASSVPTVLAVAPEPELAAVLHTAVDLLFFDLSADDWEHSSQAPLIRPGQAYGGGSPEANPIAPAILVSEDQRGDGRSSLFLTARVSRRMGSTARSFGRFAARFERMTSSRAATASFSFPTATTSARERMEENVKPPEIRS